MNFDFEYQASFVTPNVFLPTHFQLIKWLKDEHNIDVQMQANGLFDVQNIFGDYERNGKGEKEFEINEALEIGLKAI